MMTFLRCLGEKNPAGIGKKILRGFCVIVYRPLADGATSPVFSYLVVGFTEFVLSLLPQIAYAEYRNR